jgi:hypothetical protein
VTTLANQRIPFALACVLPSWRYFPEEAISDPTTTQRRLKLGPRVRVEERNLRPSARVLVKAGTSSLK